MKIAGEKLTRKHEDGMYEQTLVITGSPAELLLMDEALYEQGFVTKEREDKLILSSFIKNVEEHERLLSLVNSFSADIKLIPGLIGALDRMMEQHHEVDLRAVAAVPGNGNGHGNGHQ